MALGRGTRAARGGPTTWDEADLSGYLLDPGELSQLGQDLGVEASASGDAARRLQAQSSDAEAAAARLRQLAWSKVGCWTGMVVCLGAPACDNGVNPPTAPPWSASCRLPGNLLNLVNCLAVS
eukprot:361064-Chlamydomonas_euryale.AAC.1